MTQEAPIAKTDLGELKGAWGNGVAVFRGIPYAAPPVGERRFARPAAPAPWRGLRDAVADGPIAPQSPSRLRVAMGDFARPQSEDCLTLTICTPAPDGKARPVLVWLHGGAYMSGAGSLGWYNGSVLAREGDIVVVGVNYRLGALGYLYRPGLSEGNLGLFDQEAALVWVAEHIGGFGGDPGAICVAGQSAGASSIAFLLTMPRARGLVRRAILQSGPLGRAAMSLSDAAAIAERLLDALGIERKDPDAATRLRAMPQERLLEAQIAVGRSLIQQGSMALPFAPVGSELANSGKFIAVVADGAARVETILGTTRDEMHAFFAADPTMENPDPAMVAARFKQLAGDAQAIETYRGRRPDGSTTDLLGDLITDHNFRLPALSLAEAIAARRGRVWVYQFDWAPPASKFKACHCLELPLLFGNPESWPGAAMLEGADAGEMATLSAAMRNAWIAFVRSGAPDHGGMPHWPAWHRDRHAVMHFDREIAVRKE